ncbi:hypothetical protein E2C01_060421 [Portunus trituberculatus]|uniref:Uncharacterized protein n=1 Tax=Portunus trituberculatus TaxID=210409 RepID=A0A5B7HC02_PORTR|nr:hypothetical protein [Portunus trituberculatus]
MVTAQDEALLVRIQYADSKVWNRTRIVIEARPHTRQYLVKLVGSGRISVHNRHHLRQTRPLTPATPLPSQSQDSSANEVEPPDHNLTANTPRTPRPYREHRRPMWCQDYEMELQFMHSCLSYQNVFRHGNFCNNDD